MLQFELKDLFRFPLEKYTVLGGDIEKALADQNVLTFCTLPPPPDDSVFQCERAEP